MILQLQATPLHYAAENGHSLVLEHLISSGADFNAVDNVTCLVMGILTHYI